MIDHSDNLAQSKILIVDDTPANLRLLTNMLRNRGYEARPVPNGRLALQAAKHDSPDLILLDINMPVIDGYEVCRQLKQDERLKGIPVIFISALNEIFDKVKAFNTGGVDYITKPFQFEEVQARLETHLKLRSLQLEVERHNRHLEELVQEKVREISASRMSTILALAKLAESRDDVTGKHLERVQLYCRMLASRLAEYQRFEKQISPDCIENIFHASPLHDIGKVGIPDHILQKPGSLTTEEFEIMKTHALIGAQTLEAVRDRYPNNAFVNMGINFARWHHEKWDGSGYPDGLAGEDIPLEARIMAIVDVYDALRSQRPYKEAFSHAKAVDIIVSETGHFDRHIVEAFMDIQEKIKEINTYE